VSTGAPYTIPGLWPSPLSPRLIASTLRLGELCWDTDGATLVWLEGRGDHGMAVAQASGGPIRDLTPDRSVRARIGYGGGDLTVAHGDLYFVGAEDQRIYRRPLRGGLGRPITPAFGEASTPAVSPDGRWVVYVHSYEGVDSLLAVPTDGSQLPQRIAGGRDFFMQPVWHPSGEWIAWVEWDQPNMPWDGTELRLARLDTSSGNLRLSEVRRVAGGADTAVFQPAFSPDGRTLYFVSDAPGWGHLFAFDLASGSLRQLTDGACEYGRPAWNQGMRAFAVLPSGRIAAVRQERGFESLVIVDPEQGRLDPLALPPYTSFVHPVAPLRGERIACVASAGTVPPRLVVVDLHGAEPAVTILRHADPELVPSEGFSVPRPFSWTVDGTDVHGLYFPPVPPLPPGAAPPPLIVSVHGGPTSHVSATWRPYAQYFATRGWAVLEVNYRGSTGHGRPYMLAGRGRWGIVDVEDCLAGVEALGAQGLADPRRAVIFGGSAGGYTVLQSLVTYPGRYRAGVCLFGVSNLFTLASDTHKFEARYLDLLVGALPAAADRYRERSPIFHADRIVDPLIIFHGDQDRVVPLDQSETIVASLKARGVPHEFHVYQGEGHGWRRPETIEHFLRATERFLRQHVILA
jgi:dipeptidyl aminopeptidase/acylaminoacyl peptidase